MHNNPKYPYLKIEIALNHFKIVNYYVFLSIKDL